MGFCGATALGGAHGVELLTDRQIIIDDRWSSWFRPPCWTNHLVDNKPIFLAKELGSLYHICAMIFCLVNTISFHLIVKKMHEAAQPHLFSLFLTPKKQFDSFMAE